MAYNVLYPYTIFSASSMATSLTSAAIKIEYQDNAGIQLHWTGTPTGTFSFQISSNHVQDYLGNITTPGEWVTLPVSPTVTAAGVA